MEAMRHHSTVPRRPHAESEDAERPPTGRPPLERSEHHRVIAGVCGGLGRHLDIDPVVFRVVLAVLCFSGGIGLFIYGLAWLIVPIADSGRNEMQRLLTGRVDAQSLGAMLVTVLGTGILFTYMNQGNHFFPLLLIAFLTFAALRYDPAKHQRGPEQAAVRDPEAPSPPPAPTAPVPPAAAPWWQRDDPFLKVAAPNDALPQDAPPADAPPPMAAAPLSPFAPPPPPPPRRRRARRLSWLTLLLAAVTGVAVWFVQSGEHRPHNVLAVLASALLVLALGLLLGARWGRAKGLAVPALLLTLLLAATASVSPDLRTTQRTVVWSPASVAQLRSPYELGTGTGRLDLSRIDPVGGTVAVSARMGAGKLIVKVPADVEVRLTARAGVGEILLPDGSSSHGFGRTVEVDLLPSGGSHGVLALTLELGAGRMEVTR
jgi:phage shock protein PspC (stress-responsive transcriptional regulator)